MRGLLALAVLLASVDPALPHGTKTQTIEIVHPWTFGRSPRGTVIVAMTIKNTGKLDDRLIGASSPLASSVSIVAGPDARRVEAIVVVPGRAAELSPAGQHLVLDGVSKPLSPYDTIPVTLRFERAGAVTIEVLVEER